MFHRRLLLLLSLVLLVIGLLGAQVGRLSILEGEQRRSIAEASLDRVSYLPTYRGRIIDRKGNVLARDRASYEVAIDYEVITGDWALAKAEQAARREVGRETWSGMSRHERQRLAAQHLPIFEDERQQLWTMISLLGEIDNDELNTRLDRIKRRVESMAAVVHDRQRQSALREYGENSDTFEFVPRPIYEQEATHVVLDQLRDEIALEFNRFAQAQPGMIEVRDARRREYPWERVEVVIDRSTLPRPIANDEPLHVPIVGVADHILGSVRDGSRAEDIERHPFHNTETGEIDFTGYRATNDEVGVQGLEAAFESTLRGAWGRAVEHVDTGEQDRVEPQPGRDLQITLDLMLQARIQALLMPEVGLTRVQTWHQNSHLAVGTPLNAAVAVLEVETGEILALVSMPTMAMGENMNELDVERNAPWVNRAIEAVYPPGSIIKPLVLAAAVREGKHDLHQPIDCIGHYFPNLTTAARCWIYREKWGFQTHGPLFANEAIAKSCNIFFYTLADRLGMSRLMAWYADFGLGEPLDVGLLVKRLARDEETKELREVWSGEVGGSLPTEEDINRMSASGELKFTTVITGIGQGPVTWTPVHAANAFATIARGGITHDATLIPGAAHRTGPSRPDLKLSAELVGVTLDGLHLAVTEGTGHRIVYGDGGDEERILRARGVSVWAKTGTAQAPPYVLGDFNDDGTIDRSEESIEVIRGADHSWFVGLVGPRDTDLPMYSIAVIVEYGGSGGRIAGPIADQIIRALQSEGYLPDA
jgi:penicillin-binding protein 2